VSDTVLIAAPDRLVTLTAREDLSNALVFHDSDVLTAFETIARQRPRLVALERVFAETPRGVALINRIRTDPTLKACVVRIVSLTQEESGDASPAEPATSAPATLDVWGTRSVARFDMRLGVPVTLDGNPVTLLNLSIAGAQVLAAATLRPHQRVRLALLDEMHPMRLSASVKWAIYEMPKDGPRFRAGLAFLNPDPIAVTRFIDAHRR
jgi:hypothetical protein